MLRVLFFVVIVFSLNANASYTLSGIFEATQSCPAYVSKNKRFNPGEIYIQPKSRYQLKEINTIHPDWVRIVIPNNSQSLRWVSLDCGTVEYVEQEYSKCDIRQGMADSYVLALSSQPGFCETYGYEAAKPECRKLLKDSYQAKHLTLHGLWPNQAACGQNYGFCGTRPKKNHCDYDALQLSTSVSNGLKQLMPSYYYGSCLERHEWNKHGSCQYLDMDDYFDLAMRLTKEVNATVFGTYLTAHQGEQVKLAELRELLNQSFGAENSGKIHLGCKDGVLVDIYVLLPALIPSNLSVENLVHHAPEHHFHDSCSTLVTLSNFHGDAVHYKY